MVTPDNETIIQGQTYVVETSKFQFYLEHIKWQQLLAGIAGGVVTTSILHPLDLAKIRLQVNVGNNVGSTKESSSGFIKTLREVYNLRGVRGIYQGVTPNLLGSATAWGFYFFIYGALKNYAQDNDPSKPLSTPQYLGLATVSGCIVVTMTNPIWVAKTRMCLQSGSLKENATNPIMTTWRTLVSIWKGEGLNGLYRGMVPGLIGVSNGAVQFLFYELLRNFYNGTYRKRRIDTHLSVPEYLTCGTLSKAAAVIITYPYQVVRTRLQQLNCRYNGLADIIVSVWREEGARGFYKGLLPNILRTAPACGLTFVVYENCYLWLQSSSD